MSPPRLDRMLRAFRNDVDGVGAIEFALILPVMLTLLFGGFALSQGISAYRKMTTTTRTIADLVARANGSGITSAQMSQYLNASTQVMAPFATSTLTIVVSQIQAPKICLSQGSSSGTLSWAARLNSTATPSTALPAGVCQPSSYVIRADVTYAYKPAFGSGITGTFNFKDSMFMSPRQVSSITYPAT